MKSPAPRFVLAFYSQEEKDHAEPAYREILRAGVHDACLIRSSEDSAPEAWRSCAALRLEGESFVAARTDITKTGHLLTSVRQTGTPALFVVRGKRRDIRGHGEREQRAP